jgi:hypothetical protein
MYEHISAIYERIRLLKWMRQKIERRKNKTLFTI